MGNPKPKSDFPLNGQQMLLNLSLFHNVMSSSDCDAIYIIFEGTNKLKEWNTAVFLMYMYMIVINYICIGEQF